jgi:RNA polymerase sigma-70 factor (ECF subfamily)
MRDQVRKLLSNFDLETQAAAVHYHVDEMTLEEVATLLGRSVPTVRKRLEEVAAAVRRFRRPSEIRGVES